MKIANLLYEQIIKLKPIPEGESMFKSSYNSPYVKGPTKFFEIIIDPMNNVVGEIEYGDVDENTFELLSIHLVKEHRGKGFGAQAVNKLVQTLNKKGVILISSPSSKKFWKKLGFEPMNKVTSYLTKTY